MSKCPKLSDQLVRYIQRNTDSYFVYAIPENIFQITDVLDLTLLREVFANEIHRLQTFTSFPLDGVYPSFLAADGFIYQGSGYEAMCIYCGLRNANWSAGDDVHQIHRQLSPVCPLVTGVNVNNIIFHYIGSNRGDFEGLQYRHHVGENHEQEGSFLATIGDEVHDSQTDHIERTITNENVVNFNPEDIPLSSDISPQEETSVEVRCRAAQNPETLPSQHDRVSGDSSIALTANPTSTENNMISSDNIASSGRSIERAQDVSLTDLRENKIKIHISKSIASTDESLESDNNETTSQDALATHSLDISQAQGEYILTLEEGQRISEIMVSLDDNCDETSATIKTSTDVNNGQVHLRISCRAKRTSQNKNSKRQDKTELQKNNGEALMTRNLRKDKLKLLETIPDEAKQEVDIKNDPAVKLVVAMGYNEEDVWRTASTLAENSLPVTSDAILEKLKQKLRHSLTKEQFKLSEAIRRIKESYSILQPMLQDFHASH